MPHPDSSRRQIISVMFFLFLFILGAYTLLVALAPSLYDTSAHDSAHPISPQIVHQYPIREDRLYIPRIAVSIPIVSGSDKESLLTGAWHRKPENGNPERGGNYVLSAHRFNMGYTPSGTIKKSPFYHLNKVEIGDQITVDYKANRYAYIVSRKYRVDPDQISIEDTTSQPTLTLYSCTLRGSADGRDVVEARPANIEQHD